MAHLGSDDDKSRRLKLYFNIRRRAAAALTSIFFPGFCSGPTNERLEYDEKFSVTSHHCGVYIAGICVRYVCTLYERGICRHLM